MNGEDKVEKIVHEEQIESEEAVGVGHFDFKWDNVSGDVVKSSAIISNNDQLAEVCGSDVNDHSDQTFDATRAALIHMQPEVVISAEPMNSILKRLLKASGSVGICASNSNDPGVRLDG